jgi:hypothetical protein
LLRVKAVARLGAYPMLAGPRRDRPWPARVSRYATTVAGRREHAAFAEPRQGSIAPTVMRSSRVSGDWSSQSPSTRLERPAIAWFSRVIAALAEGCTANRDRKPCICPENRRSVTGTPAARIRPA